MGTSGRAQPLCIMGFRLLLINVFLPAVYAEWSGSLSAYEVSSFENPIKLSEIVRTRLDHFDVDQDIGEVYVGAVNYLYKLNKDLKQVANVSTATCYEETCRNYNKVLVLHDDRLITCGSEFVETPRLDQCQSRRLRDLVGDGSQRNLIVSFGMRSTASIVAPGKYNGNPSTQLYVATSYSPQAEYERVPPITRRLLVTGNGFMFADGEDTVSFTEDYTNSYDANPAPIGYVSAFTWKGFTYFATTQRQSLSSVHRSRVSKLIRLCHNTDDVDSYTEIFIDCSGSSGTFSLVQAAHVGPAGPHLSDSLMLDNDDQVLYAVFAKASSSDDNPIADSALCVYKMSDIEAAFKEAVRQCLNQADVNEVPFFSGTVCNDQNIPDSSPYLCNAGNRYVYATGRYTDRVRRTSLVRMAGHQASSIITSADLNHTVAFIGTTGGRLLKVHVENSVLARLYERVTLDGNAVMGDTMLNETSQQVYVLTKQKLIKMNIENCGQYTTCEACIGTDAGNDGDPYCGWCTLERRCTRYLECPMQDVSTRWLAYNSAQCIKISQVAPHNSLPITETDQKITLTVQQLPELLDSEQYVCRFENRFSFPAVNYNGDTFDCQTPPNNLPTIPTGEDHAVVLLSVMSTETGVNFVDIDFNFYECNTHKTCVSCVGSRWACNWCVFENKCTHDNTTCQKSNEIIITGNNTRGTAMEGPDSCPQILQQSSEKLIPNQVSRDISVAVANLPDPSQTKSFECTLTVEGTEQMIEAVRSDPNVTCNMRPYNYTTNEQELRVGLTLRWTDADDKVHVLDDRYQFTVTLYKCEVLRPDCSRCVSEETARAKLGCVWCGNTCGVMDSAVCDNAQMVTPNNGLNCPDPVLQKVYPLFGPIEGNTLITLTGTDIGRRFSDVINVTVAGKICALENKNYSTGSSVSCTTPPNASNSRRRRDVSPGTLRLQVAITGADGNTQLSQGDDVVFGYKDPMLNAMVDPNIGPRSGGTRLTLSGESLDAGRYIQVFVGDMPCETNRLDVTDDSIICITSRAENIGTWGVNVSFDGSWRRSGNYSYAVDPDVRYIDPSTSVLAGGRKLTVNGSRFSIIQQPQIVITHGMKQREFVGNCTVKNDEIMVCMSPEIVLPNSALPEDSSVNVSTGFIMDNVEELRTWCRVGQRDCTPLEYFQDPEYYPFTDAIYNLEDGIGMKEGNTMIIQGRRLDLAITDEEVTVYIGKELCTGVTVDEGALSCTLPEEQPAAGDYRGRNTTDEQRLPIVWVIHGTTLSFNIGYFRYFPTDWTILIACTVSVGVLVLAVLLAVGLQRKSKAAQKEVDKRLDDIDKVQQDLAEDMRTAFAELQTDVSDLTSDLEGIGMPFVSHREYTTNMLFIGQETKPSTTDPENPEEHVERAMMKFSAALGNKTFLLMLLQTLDAQSKARLSVMDRGAIASLLTIVMVAEGKLDYLSDVLFTLMSRLVQDELDANRPRQLFRRTETILEKLLSNWITLCLYDSLKDHTAYPLFLLYRAIKCHSEHGPIDIISGQAKFTLSDDKLLTEEVEYREMVLTVIVNDADGETKEVKVLDLDTISQVKEKILDAIYRNQPYSSRPSAHQVDLEWRQGKEGHLILRDLDITSATLDGWKRVNTLKFYHVPNKSTMALIEVSSDGTRRPADNVYANLAFQGGGANNFDDSYPTKPSAAPRSASRNNRYTMVEIDMDEKAKAWHLVKFEEGDLEYPTTKRRNKRLSKRLSRIAVHPKKRIRELYMTRLIGTKGTIQEYIDHMFTTILDPGTAPKAVKYLFDFFDSQAIRHSIPDAEDAIKTWKGNSLSLRFWSNAIRRPDFIFDIKPSRSVEASLGIIAQAFYDAHNTSDHKLGKDSDLSKLLFNKDLPRIQGLVDNYYDAIFNKQRVSQQELNREMAQTCQNFTGLFSKLSTLQQLWDYVKKYNQKVVEACEEDEACQQQQLAYKLVEVETFLLNEDCDAEQPV
ncbi:plexin-B-like isoform X2 [Acanthaster planci]|nr:plexin-B-like isoform X2 [Acanthaster planci]XP_022105361.1 plexin-B-like isoform X2 [Acanthaster planci]XP_022105362.1 plexin-B-like isoform X2 [Acanthaster planci]